MNTRDPELEQIGPLKVLRVKGDPQSPTIVLFHGYGASAYDLYPLHQYIFPERKLNWIFPDGHLEIPLGPGYIGKAWFPIDMEALQRAMASGTFRDFAEITPPGLDIARNKAQEMIEQLGIPFQELILGGFSQGAMLTTDLSLRSEIRPKGLIVLSGTLLNKDIWKELASKKSMLTFFQSHGKQDMVLGFKPAKELNKLFHDAGMVGEFVEFYGGHEIPMEVIEGVNRYLKTLV
ncbi:MAG: esterase [Leptospiraceae bacterium]|nr:esterase [Leptospiraceae bacterium]